jgi:hypothetical protein
METARSKFSRSESGKMLQPRKNKRHLHLSTPKKQVIHRATESTMDGKGKQTLKN